MNFRFSPISSSPARVDQGRLILCEIFIHPDRVTALAEIFIQPDRVTALAQIFILPDYQTECDCPWWLMPFSSILEAGMAGMAPNFNKSETF